MPRSLDVPVHVNVSAQRLARPDLHAVIDWALGHYKLEASRLVIEDADTNRIEGAGVASSGMQRIRDRGVRVASKISGARSRQGELYGPALRLQRMGSRGNRRSQDR